jgi:hypothetical protein
MASNGKPTALKLFFIRSTRVRKDVMPGEPAGDVGDLMKVVPRGAKAMVQFSAAKDLIIGGSALEDNLANRERIAEAEVEIQSANKRDADRVIEKNQPKKQLQKAA